MIFDRSLSTGIVPNDWRIAHVTPIFKKGVKSDPGNYRPVSLTSIPGKILESIIRDAIMEHLEINSLIFDTQHGFMNKKSTVTNLLDFMETVTDTTDKGEAMDIIYLDFSKAFDLVPKSRLLNKLSAHGISGSILNWIGAWLTNRKQKTVLNGKSSDWGEVLSGVPQGSVLGPLLFLIFINDIDKAAHMITKLAKFADDTKLGQVIRSQQDRIQLQECLNSLVEWSETWGMSFNVAKCKIMHVGTNNPKYKYHMKGQELLEVEEEKDIGVLIKSNLKPKDHCTVVAGKARGVLYQIVKNFHFRDKLTFIRLYKTFVRPHLEYAAAVWNPWQVGDIDLLESVQKKAVGMVSGLKGKNYEEKLREIGLDSLKTRRLKIDMTETFKIVNGFAKVKYDTWFQLYRDIPNLRTTRLNQDPMNLKRSRVCNTDIRNNFFSQRVINNWNLIPANIKKSKTISSFKSQLSRYLETTNG